MKSLVWILFLGLVTVVHGQQLSMMSYNIKLDYPKEGENSWANRKPFFMAQIRFHMPDVLGVQEALPNQMGDMSSVLPEYSFIGVGRDDGKEQGEYSAIFYKRELFDVLDSGTFWLSPTPEKPSLGWDAAYNRICTYALFKNKKTGERFWMFNTHFDHIGEIARKNSAVLILQKIKSLNSQGYPVVLSGDFNMEPSHKGIEEIQKELTDSKEIAAQVFGPEGTFNNFDFHSPVTTRIDYIFVSSAIEVDTHAVLSDNKDCRYPSDHLPVFIRFHFKE
ncbi:endonuclease/exonuclease/phosphatase family protein [Imtechella halotolerans]|uniref:Endonuclease/exonuclease/phosphatase n=1 Tax=Imtechella halotolerans K1 TaxID=946077 RepID=I0WF71_9FLAO|nr:endonuclease/exonuclease/phosphatase family protein [Imtechella halotolerans]EID75037.1 endonuclease/exonuclease/phosphatase [Imtechella halotolerans K1]WMQ63807.1 endonuclease/exonuclease/phosphatase family protein [Imtechella halotolerans]